jgi:hypothetical protein
MSIVLQAAKKAAESDREFLLASRVRLGSETETIRSRMNLLRTEIVRALIGGDALPPRSDLAEALFTLQLHESALAKLDVDLPAADLACELADLKLRKHIADDQVAKADAEIEKMRASVPPGAKLDVSKTSANLDKLEAQRDQGRIADAYDAMAKMLR